ncbi:hypothetical protein LTR85_004829 [Meristemomyces frigidus]|nr:hypothetical protein LTR85_004829 [Meristemomyces frigidus]
MATSSSQLGSPHLEETATVAKKKVPKDRMAKAAKTWREYNEGDFFIKQYIDSAVKEVRVAYYHLYRGLAVPTTQLLRKAYRDRVENNTPSCELTQTWVQFLEDATGSPRNVTLDHASYRGERPMPPLPAPTPALPTPMDWPHNGPPLKPLPSELPFLDDAYRIVQDWVKRGRDHFDGEIHSVRAAKYVIGCHILEQSAERTSS